MSFLAYSTCLDDCSSCENNSLSGIAQEDGLRTPYRGQTGFATLSAVVDNVGIADNDLLLVWADSYIIAKGFPSKTSTSGCLTTNAAGMTSDLW